MTGHVFLRASLPRLLWERAESGGCVDLISFIHLEGYLVAQTVKKSPAMQETWVQSLRQEDPLETGMATHSSIPAWRIPWTEELGRLQSMGSQSQTRLSD